MNKKLRYGITKKDVAKLAKVSHMTVTRALRGGCIKKETKKKVLEACEKLGYNPNLLAYGLSTKKSLLIGVIVATLKHTYYPNLVNSIERTAEKNQYHIIAIDTSDEGNVNWESVSFLLGRKVDGLIISALISDNIVQKLKNIGLPIVLTDSDVKNYNFPFVGTEDIKGAEEAVSYLINLGHKKIAHLGGLKNSYTGKRRFIGYKKAFKKNNIQYNKNLVIFTNYHLDGGYEGTKKLIERGVKFSAIFAASDYVAIGSLAYLHEKGIKVPDDISVVGFTGDEIGEYTCPSLTTMAQPVEEMGKKAVEMILESGKKKTNEVQKIFLPSKLIIRNSCVEK